MKLTRTQDLHTAAFLYAVGIPLVRVYWDGKMATYIYDNTRNQADKAVQRFNSNPPVPAQTLLNAWHHIQKLLRSARDGERSAA